MGTLPLIIILVAGGASAGSVAARTEKEPHLAKRGQRHGLIHPLLDTEDYEFKEQKPFQHRLERLRDKLRSEKKISVMAVYFRDLDNGLAFGVDAQLPFQPASLLKLPVMMALLKKHESDPGLLQRKAALRPAPAAGLLPTFPPSVKLKPGKEYSVDELLSAMISRSDNDATNTLLGALTEEDYTRIYEDLGLRIPHVRDERDPVTVREYATFFRILYNASYLSKDLSQRALEYLAASDFDVALRAGVPKEVPVAHKFGETGELATGERQLHDCGIVYHPREPYLLCLMTRGRDMKAMAAGMAEASKVTWEAVEDSSKAGEDAPR